MSSKEHSDNKLHEAVRFGDLESVIEALEDGLDPNEIGLYNWSPLHEASHNGDVAILELLLKNNGEPNHADALKGCTALHYAAKEGHTECLELLIQAGGRYDVKNNEGDNCLDVAAKDCEEILEFQYAKDLIKQRREYKSPKQNNDIKGETVVHENPRPHKPAKSPEVSKKKIANLDKHASTDSGIVHDIKASTSKHTDISLAWANEKKTTTESCCGHLLLSFEYNAHKCVLKVRVWQLCDILLPPAETSMVGVVYVKSFLLPEDKKQDSKRKTEELKVENVLGSKHGGASIEYSTKQSFYNLQQASIVFQPVCLKFLKALEYKNISRKDIEKKTVQLQVCVSHKYTRKSYTVATVSLPLKEAVKKLVREKFSLGYTTTNLPENLSIYGADELSSSSYRSYNSNPNLRNPSLIKLHTDTGERASSDSDLKRVQIDKMEKVPSIVISMPTEDQGDEFSLVVNSDRSASHSDLTTVDMPGTIDQDDLSQVKVEQLRKSKSTPDLSTDEELTDLDNSASSQKGTFLKSIAKQRKDALSQLEKGNKHKKKSHGKHQVEVIGDANSPELQRYTRTKDSKDINTPKGRVSPAAHSGINSIKSDQSHGTGKRNKPQRILPDPSNLNMSVDRTLNTGHNNTHSPTDSTVIQYEDDLTGTTTPEKYLNSRKNSLQSYQPKSVKDYSPAKIPSPKSPSRREIKTSRHHERSSTNPSVTSDTSTHSSLYGDPSDDVVVAISTKEESSYKLHVHAATIPDWRYDSENTAPVHKSKKHHGKDKKVLTQEMETYRDECEILDPFAVPSYDEKLPKNKQITSL